MLQIHGRPFLTPSLHMKTASMSNSAAVKASLFHQFSSLMSYRVLLTMAFRKDPKSDNFLLKQRDRAFSQRTEIFESMTYTRTNGMWCETHGCAVPSACTSVTRKMSHVLDGRKFETQKLNIAARLADYWNRCIFDTIGIKLGIIACWYRCR